MICTAATTSESVQMLWASGEELASIERECLVAKQSRLVNRMKSTLVRLGFNPQLKCASEHLEKLRTPEARTLSASDGIRSLVAEQ